MADKPKDTGRRILFSAQKNEGPFLLEWIAYHKVVGFTDIIIFSNDCNDGSDDLLDALSDAGEIQHYRHEVPSGIAPQANAAALGMDKSLFEHGDWIMWLDIDEYLYIKRGTHKLNDLFGQIGDADAVGFAWRVFGDGGNEVWPGRQISEDFILASKKHFAPNTQVKTLFRYTPLIKGLHLHRPIFHKNVTGNDQYKFIHSGKKLVPSDFFQRYFFSTGDPFHRVPAGEKRYILGQINHYTVRTPDMFARKTARGRGHASPKSTSTRHDAEFYNRYNRNTVIDRKILNLLAELNAELSRLRNRLNSN